MYCLHCFTDQFIDKVRGCEALGNHKKSDQKNDDKGTGSKFSLTGLGEKRQRCKLFFKEHDLGKVVIGK